MASNAQQIENWNGPGGKRWVTDQETIDAAISPFGLEAIRRLSLIPGETVLDVGCGCGHTLLQLREEVGASGQVTGLDISAPMLTVARERAQAAGYENVTAEEGDAAEATLPAPGFDALYSRFGVMFFADPEAAFANMMSALKPRGRMSFVCWQAASDNSWMTGPMEALRDVIDLPPPGDATAPGPFAFADGDRVQKLIASAGFHDVAFEAWDREMSLGGGSDIEAATKAAVGVGPTGGAIRAAGAENYEKCMDAVRNWITERMTPDGVKLAAATWMFRGQKPG